MTAEAAFALLIPALASCLSALAVYARSEARKSSKLKKDVDALFARVKVLEEGKPAAPVQSQRGGIEL